MSTLTKVFVVLTSVLSIALSCLFVAASAQWANWKKLSEQYMIERDAAITHQQSAVASMQAALAMKDESLAARTRELEQTLAKLASLASDLESSKRQLAQTENERLAFDADRKKLQEILDVTAGELKSLQAQNKDMLAKTIELQTRNAQLNARVLELTTNVAILTDETRNIQEKLIACQGGRRFGAAEGGADVTAAGVRVELPQVMGEIRGRVTRVDGGYASIDVGENSGVAAGMKFMVYRSGGKFLGELLVERLRPTEAGAKVTLAVEPIQAGDLVVSAAD